MADGDPLRIGRNNNGDNSTVLDRSGAQSRSALIVTNANGKGLQADATGNAVEASSTSGIAVLATSTATPGVRGVGQPVGVEGVGQSITRRATDGVGVSGFGYYGVKGTGQYSGVSFLHRNAVGVFGESSGGTGVKGVGTTGVSGDGTGSSTGVGVFGESSSGTGVRGVSRGSSTGVGVFGESSSGTGVRGVSGGSSTGVGVVGECLGGTGVSGSGGPSSAGTGVVGVSGGTGVRGTGTTGVQGFGTELGVLGRVNTVAGGPRTAFVGVFGDSNSSHGVFGRSTAPDIPNVIVGGVTGVSSQNGVVGESTGQAAGVFGFSSSGIGVSGSTDSGLAARFFGTVHIIGDLLVTDNKSAVVRDSAGKHRRLYALESPESWFEDFGFAKLVRGRARVAIKRDFVQFIHSRNYHVFLTPEGDSNGLYVTKKSAAAFEVVEQQDGQSGARFSYRIVAKLRDSRGRRLERVRMPKVIQKLNGKIAAPKLPRRSAQPGRTSKPGRRSRADSDVVSV